MKEETLKALNAYRTPDLHKTVEMINNKVNLYKLKESIEYFTIYFANWDFINDKPLEAKNSHMFFFKRHDGIRTSITVQDKELTKPKTVLKKIKEEAKLILS